jgi:hypothetical protein
MDFPVEQVWLAVVKNFHNGESCSHPVAVFSYILVTGFSASSQLFKFFVSFFHISLDEKKKYLSKNFTAVLKKLEHSFINFLFLLALVFFLTF